MHTFPTRSLVVALAITLAGCGSKTPEERIAAASEALKSGDVKTAEIEAKSALQDAPGNAAARMLLAQTLQRMGRWADSEKELRKAQERGAAAEQVLPLLAQALMKMGKPQDVVDIPVPTSGMGSLALASFQAERANAYMALNKRDEASREIAEAEQVLQGVGGKEAFSRDLALAKARLAAIGQRQEEAMAILDDALRRDGKFIDAYYLKAQLLAMQGKREEVRKVYEQIIATKPDEVMAHLAIADAKLQAQDLAGAEKALQAAEKVNAGLPLVKHTRAKLALLKGDLKTANEAVQQVLKVAPDHLPTVMLDAVVSYGLGNHEQSLKSANKVLGQTPGHLPSAKLVASNELRRGNAKLALDTLTPFLAQHPEDAQLLATLGEAHLQLKQFDKAMALLDRAAAQRPDDPAIKQSQARGHLAQGRPDQAMRELEQAASLSEQASQADISLIMLHMARKEFDPALQAIARLEKKLPNNPVMHNLRGGAHLGKGDRAAARKAFEQALSAQPGFYPAAANLARLDVADKKPDAARQRFEAVLKADPKSAQAMMALAEMAAAAGKEPEMVSWMEKAAGADPKAIPPRAGLVRYHLAKKAPQKALPIAREAANANPDSPEALSLLGSVQMASGDKPSSLSTFAKVTEKAPNSAEAFYRLGAAQVASEQVAKGRQSFEKALTLQPGHVGAFDGLLLLDVADKQVDRALQRSRSFQAQNPKSPLGYFREGDILLGQNKYDQAAKAFERGLVHGNDLKSFAKMQAALVRAGNQKLADQKVADLLARYPKDPRVRAYGAEYYLNLGRNQEAQRQYEELIKLQPNNAFNLNNLALVYQRLKDGRALATAEQALKLAPEHAGILDTVGWILVEQGNAARALELLKRAADKLPKSASVRYHYAAALAKAGKKAEARSELGNLLKGEPRFPEADEARKLLATL